VRQVLQNRRGQTVVRDVPLPQHGPHQVLMRNAFSAISVGTERARVEARTPLQRVRERPDLVRELPRRAMRNGVGETIGEIRAKLLEERPGGYSSAGVVLAVGELVRGIAPGDRVACAGAGYANHAEVVAVPGSLCARVPDSVDLEQAALTTIAAIGLHAVRTSDVRVGERVAVIGCGLIGQIVCRLLRAAGAETFAVDLERSRVERAVASGADHGVGAGDAAAATLRSLTRGVGLDHVIVAAAARTPDALLLALDAARDRGSVVVIGDVPPHMPREPLYRKELHFQVSRSYGPGRYDPEYEERGLDYPIAYVRWSEQRNMEAVLDLLARERLTLRDLIDEVLPVEQAAQAFARLLASPPERPNGALLVAYPDAPTLPPLKTAVPAPRPTAGPPAIGLIGPGGFASHVLVPAFRAEGARMELVAGGAGPSSLRAVQQLGFRRFADGAEAVIADPAVDAVVISTRHADHASQARAALEAGKHVFCEKPLALCDDELDEVLAAARAAGRVLAVGFNRRFSPHLRALRDLVASTPGPITVVYRIAAGALPAEDWQNDPGVGGGRLRGEVCHFIDSVRYLAGHPIVAVNCSGFSRLRLPRTSVDNLVLSLECADGSQASIVYVASASRGLGKEHVEVFSAGGVGVLRDFRTVELHRGGRIERRQSRIQDKGHRGEIHAFLRGIASGESPVSLDEVENSTRATLAAAESLLTCESVSVAKAALPEAHR
jgi:predicted dehydrogenase/threonine dehydrogenase-like Zn-dependent dehydrogenase